MHKPIEFRVSHIARHEDGEARTIIDDKVASDTSTYETIRLLPVEPGIGVARVGSSVGNIWVEHALSFRVQHPEMLGQFKLGDVVTLTIKR